MIVRKTLLNVAVFASLLAAVFLLGVRHGRATSGQVANCGNVVCEKVAHDGNSPMLLDIPAAFRDLGDSESLITWGNPIGSLRGRPTWDQPDGKLEYYCEPDISKRIQLFNVPPNPDENRVFKEWKEWLKPKKEAFKYLIALAETL
jgi:hypothetical protein